MAQIRAELGPDALILSDRSRDGQVEVTAALETDETPTLRPRALPPSSLHDLEPFSPGIIRAPQPTPRLPTVQPSGPTAPRAAAPAPGLAAALAWHGLPPSLAAILCEGPLDAQCARVFRFTQLPLGAHDAPLLLAGPAGGGKTLTAARLATRLVLSGQRPLVVTADGQRAGAVEQLAAFTRLLGLTLVAAHTPKILARALERRDPGQPVLIDAPGLDPGDPHQAAELRSLLEASGATLALVLPCGLDPGEAQDVAAVHAAFDARALIATRTDVSRRLGGILSACAATGLPLAEAGISSSAADGLAPVTPAFLAERLRTGGPSMQAASVRSVSAAAEPEATRVLVHAALPLHIAAQRRNTPRS
nr:GTP-binding protein [uncultured Lichenicoccus sp.]